MKLTFLRAFDQLIPADDQTIDWFINLDSREYITVELPDSPRTGKQNSAIRVYCRELAEALNNAGYDMSTFPFKEGFKLPWSEHTTMDFLWRVVMEAMTGKTSTRDLDTKEVSQVYEVLSKKLAEVAGVTLPFPSKESE